MNSTKITSTEAEKILKWCNTQLNNFDNWYKNKSTKEIDDTNFRKAMAALGIKMIMFCGITYRELRKLKWCDYDEERVTIEIRGFEIRVPINMHIQLQIIKDFVIDNEIKNDEDFIFINPDGEQWGEVTSYSAIPDNLNALIKKTSVNLLVNYGISQLVLSGLSDAIIKKLTGAREALIDSSINPEDKNICQLVNKAVICSDIYYNS